MANRKKMGLITAGVLGGLTVIGLMVGCSQDEADTTAPSDQTAVARISEETTSSSLPSTTTSTAEPAAPVEPTGSSCGDPTGAPGFETAAQDGVVPDVACMDLQLAQDKLQAANIFRIESVDGSGQDRNQAWDRNWVVVSQEPAAGAQAAAGTTVTLTALKYGEAGAPPVFDASTPGRVPNVVCFDLQEAQDTLQSAGFYVINSEDGTGEGRAQLIDSNWRVTAQTPGPGGSHDKSTSVLVKAVKEGEPSSC